MAATDVERIVAEYGRHYPPLITARQAAEIAHRAVQTVYEWSSRGRLDACKVPQRGRLLLHRDPFVRLVLGLD